jgi:mannose-1-phosphate guanylyltransferase
MPAKRAPEASFYPVILAGGRGTRFWPLSRKRRAKQLLALDGKQTMIQQTLARLLPLAPAERCWIITNNDSTREILRQLPRLEKTQVIAEPIGRNTAPAIGLAAAILLHRDPHAILGVFPSDHVIADAQQFRRILQQGINLATAGENMVVLGIRPSRPETGYGYIEAGDKANDALRVRRFTEKPDATHAASFVEKGNYYWNSGMFLWSARTIMAALQEHLPKTAALVDEIGSAFGTAKFSRVFRQLYPKCENISIDYAVLEPQSAKGEDESNLYCLPAAFGWNDLGSWTALHEHHCAKSKVDDGNLISASGVFTLDATGNLIQANGKFVAAIGVHDLVVVETEDALLITTRARAQDTGKVVNFLDEKKLHGLV